MIKKVRDLSPCIGLENFITTFCNMIDMGFKGPRFTWFYLRSAGQLIQEHIDLVFTNPECHLLYGDAVENHATRTKSDHRPVLLNLFCKPLRPNTKPVRF